MKNILTVFILGMLSFSSAFSSSSIESNDFLKSIAYDAKNEKGVMLNEWEPEGSSRSIIWSNDADKPFFAVCLPHDGNEATVGNGTMISFGAESKEQVHEIYQAATDNGGSCEGEPGMRGDAYYMAYFRDPDGNKFSAFYSVK